MKIIKPSFEIIDEINGEEILKKIEKIGRCCYASENLIKEGSAAKFVKSLLEKHHESVVEHFSFTVKFITDRSISHQIVRHRISSFAQRSQRYVNYSKDKFGSEIEFIQPLWVSQTDASDVKSVAWKNQCESAEKVYMQLLEANAKPEEARAVLPNSTATLLYMTANLREWRHFFKMRCDKSADPEIRRIAIPLMEEMQKRLPIIFDDLGQ